MKHIALACALIITLTGTVYAERRYVVNTPKVTLRTGPGIDNKVVQMLESGQEVDVLEPGKDWSRVLVIGGKEGWTLSRFISSEMPSDLLLKSLTQKHENLFAHAAGLEEENKQLTAELADIKDALSRMSNEYSNLKKESVDFLILKAKYEKANLELSFQTNKVRELNETLLQRNINIGLLGAGILLCGFIIGFSTKKQRRRSSLL
jgi:SH3 domain protein